MKSFVFPSIPTGVAAARQTCYQGARLAVARASDGSGGRMNLIATLAPVVAPVFLIALGGYVWARAG
jgi:hypothetical protein